MPKIPTHIVPFQFNDQKIHCCVPIVETIEHWYAQERAANASTPFPYWAKVWPAALALCTFITENPSYAKDKNVLEIAAGVGLPGMIAAHFANSVTISDYIPEAIELINASIHLNQMTHVKTVLLDWNDLPQTLHPDIVLMSDISYDPNSFDQLYAVIKQLIEMQITIVLSAPQRIWSKSFLIQLLPWIHHQQEIEILQDNEITFTTVWVLKLK